MRSGSGGWGTKLRLLPGAEQAAEDDEFARVVGRVVGDEEGFTQQRLSFAPGEGFGEGCGVGCGEEMFEGLTVFIDLVDGVDPGVRGGRRGVGGPVGVGPLAGLVGVAVAVVVAREVKDVALGDADVLEDLPGRVREVVPDLALKLWREAFRCFGEGGVGLLTFEELLELQLER